MNLSYVEMVQNLAKPGTDILDKLDPDGAHLLHMALGFATELFELWEAISKDDRENVIEELGDALFYLQGIKLYRSTDELKGQALTAYPSQHDVACTLNSQAEVLLSAIKGEIIYGKTVDVEYTYDELLSEIVRSLQYVGKYYNISFADFRGHNMAKLFKRYGKTYSDDAAKLRADKLPEQVINGLESEQPEVTEDLDERSAVLGDLDDAPGEEL